MPCRDSIVTLREVQVCGASQARLSSQRGTIIGGGS